MGANNGSVIYILNTISGKLFRNNAHFKLKARTAKEAEDGRFSSIDILFNYQPKYTMLLCSFLRAKFRISISPHSVGHNVQLLTLIMWRFFSATTIITIPSRKMILTLFCNSFIRYIVTISQKNSSALVSNYTMLLVKNKN